MPLITIIEAVIFDFCFHINIKPPVDFFKIDGNGVGRVAVKYLLEKGVRWQKKEGG